MAVGSSKEPVCCAVKCPFCSHDGSSVVDSRVGKEGVAIRRRRECEKCRARFTTYERIEELLPMVMKKDGRREAFDRQKLLAGWPKESGGETAGRSADSRRIGESH